MISAVLQLQEPVWKIRFVLITEARLVEDAEHHRLVFTFSANGFLYKQIRNMVGTLLKIGNDRMPIEQIDLILERRTAI